MAERQEWASISCWHRLTAGKAETGCAENEPSCHNCHKKWPPSKENTGLEWSVLTLGAVEMLTGNMEPHVLDKHRMKVTGMGERERKEEKGCLTPEVKFLGPWPGNGNAIICVAGTAKGDHIKRRENCEGHTSNCRRETCGGEQRLAERIRAGGKETQY